jgi:hypothetical protein
VLTLVAAIVGGLVAGYALGGRLANLEHLRLRAPWLVLLALAVQLVVFSPLSEGAGDTAIVATHIASYALILTFVVANLRTPGIAIAGAGTALNALVIVANGGLMPATRAALAFAGIPAAAEPHNNSAVADAGVRLVFLGDVMAVPEWVPLVANVFSIGDVLIAVGVAWLVAAGMRAPARARADVPFTTDGEPEAR